MSNIRIGALLIGQSPRPDLVSALECQLPGCEIIQAGALDGMLPANLPKTKGKYPLSTRMGGIAVKVEEEYLVPKLQAALNRLEKLDVSAAILMCAGTFLNLVGKNPLFKPFEIGCLVLRNQEIKSIGLITPFEEQEEPICHRWRERGFEATIWTEDINKQDPVFHRFLREKIAREKLQAIVLDYVGHSQEYVQQLRKEVDIPVLDLGQLAIAMLASTVGDCA